MICPYCGELMMLHYEKRLDKGEGLWYYLLIWFCDGCNTVEEEREYL